MVGDDRDARRSTPCRDARGWSRRRVPSHQQRYDRVGPSDRWRSADDVQGPRRSIGRPDVHGLGGLPEDDVQRRIDRRSRPQRELRRCIRPDVRGAAMNRSRIVTRTILVLLLVGVGLGLSACAEPVGYAGYGPDVYGPEVYGPDVYVDGGFGGF